MRSLSASPWTIPLLVGALAACSSPETAHAPEDVSPVDVPVGTDKPAPEDAFVPQDVPPPPDAGEPVDAPAPPPDVVTPPPDVFTPPPDRPVVRDVATPPPDVPVRVDVPITPDVPARMDVVATPDVPVRPDVPAVMDVPVVTDRPIADAGTPMTGSPVLAYLNDPQRTGAYRAETRLTPAALRAGRLGRVTAFNPTLEGPLYSQPLYVPGLTVGGATRDVLFVATEGNFVYALDADTGAQLWRTAVGSTVARAQQSCGNIQPSIGVTSTPVIDLATRTLYAVSFTSDSGLRFRINALDLATGTQRAGYPVAIRPPAFNGSTFDETVTGQRGALGFREGRVYVPFGGLYGDCGIYHGWVVGIDAAAPTRQVSFATPGRGSGIWAPAGLSMDAAGRIFVATGNSTPLGGHTPGSFGEFVLRLATGAAGPTFAMSDPSAQFSPSDARTLDLQDLDIGSVAPVVLPTPAGATPLVLQAGKAGTAYLLNANNLGGATPLASTRLSSGGVFGAMGAWANATETYAFVPVRGTRAGCSGSNGVVALRVQSSSAGATLATAWCSASVSSANPPVVTSNGNADAVLWVVGAATPGVLRAYEVATGMEVYANTEAPPSARQWVPPVVADGRVYVTGSSSIALYRLR